MNSPSSSDSSGKVSRQLSMTVIFEGSMPLLTRSSLTQSVMATMWSYVSSFFLYRLSFLSDIHP